MPRLSLFAMGAIAALLTVFNPGQTQTAIANGDTRTISLINVHTKEQINATFRVNGQYDQAVLDKLNWFLRDWRHDEPTKMDPHLFDIVWETYRESGSREPIVVMSAYRSPATNAMLRRRSRAVAKFSQHILGKAMDMHYTDVSMERIREIGMRLQQGGVGYYPTAGTPFVHLDAGNVRSWPRMGYDQLARLFPDGKTVHIPANGQPLARYEEARAEIERSGSAYVPVSSVGKTKSFFAALFGGGEEEDAPLAGKANSRQLASNQRGGQQMLASANMNGDDERGFFLREAQRVASLNQPSAALQPLIKARVAIPAIPVAEPIAPVTVPAGAPVEIASLVDAGNAAPLPPRRPAALLMAYNNVGVPLPPSRPVETALLQMPNPGSDAIGRLIKSSPATAQAFAQALPDVITQGTGGAAKPVPLTALGYAETPTTASITPRTIIGVKSPANAVVASLIHTSIARPSSKSSYVQRASLRGMVNAASATSAPSTSVTGAAAPALRSVQRAQAAAFFADPMPGVAERFDIAANAPPADKFMTQ